MNQYLKGLAAFCFAAMMASCEAAHKGAELSPPKATPHKASQQPSEAPAAAAKVTQTPDETAAQQTAAAPLFDLTSLAQGSQIYIRIFKQEAELEVWAQAPSQSAYVLRRSFPICKWSGDLGPKLREGDGQSPEGFYSVRKGSLNPNSSYHLSFNLGFPNRYDRAHGRTGSYLMVHGNCVSIGCYAMTDGGIEQIYGAVERALGGGQDHVKVHIFPFRMSDENMRATHGHKWEGFWQNLKEGYDAFEMGKQPPDMGVNGKRYVVRG